MHYTLLLRLAGPLQSWGSSSRFSVRATESAPTRSGVIGLLASALGMHRTAPLTEFDSLAFGVRIEAPGELLEDFHTAHQESGKAMPLSRRYYLQDAVFLAGVSGPNREVLEGYERAIRAPHFVPYLGRRSCPPDGPIETRIVDGDVRMALRAEPWRAARAHSRKRALRAGRDLMLISDALPGEQGVELRDRPISFDPRERRYGSRTVAALDAVRLHHDGSIGGAPERPSALTSSESGIDHDPMDVFEEGPL